MSAPRILSSLIRHAPRRVAVPNATTLSTARVSCSTQRYLNTDTALVLYSAHATVVGARNGHIKGTEGLDVKLSMPMALGGEGGYGKTNPEDLFAACYGSISYMCIGW